MIHKERITVLNNTPVQDRDYILYWMQASQRIHCNHALAYAIDQANERQKPLVVFFGITDHFPDANLRHYAFMLQGLEEVYKELEKRYIPFIVQAVSPEKGALNLSGRADLVVTDRGYLRIEKAWRTHLASEIECPLIQVETDVIVPVETAYHKSAFGAYVLRPKIYKQLIHFQSPLALRELKSSAIELEAANLFPNTWQAILNRMNLDSSVPVSSLHQGGYSRAEKQLKDFIAYKLDHFHTDRNDPSVDRLSHLSPYLHFGQISSLDIVFQIDESESPGKEAFLEELIVRRELSINFVHYEPDYDTFDALPDWARKTLLMHSDDPREYVYSTGQFENAETHDPYWNAAQREMIITGKMHGYMRMYWGKKILEWSGSPQKAHATALYLNNKYELDGRDPNGFAGVLWCFGKHDRAWAERPVLGKVRSMSAKGLERKFDIKAYVEKIEKMETSG